MSSIIDSQAADIPANMTTTGFDVPGFIASDRIDEAVIRLTYVPA
jgi:hypothetical protein